MLPLTDVIAEKGLLPLSFYFPFVEVCHFSDTQIQNAIYTKNNIMKSLPERVAASWVNIQTFEGSIKIKTLFRKKTSVISSSDQGQTSNTVGVGRGRD